MLIYVIFELVKGPRGQQGERGDNGDSWRQRTTSELGLSAVIFIFVNLISRDLKAIKEPKVPLVPKELMDRGYIIMWI